MRGATVLPLSGLTIVPGDYGDEQILIQVDFCFRSPHPFLSAVNTILPQNNASKFQSLGPIPLKIQPNDDFNRW